MLKALDQIKTGTAPGHSDVSLQLIAASGEVEIQVIIKLCQIVLDGLGLPAECALSAVFPIFKGVDDIRNCIFYAAMKLIKHGMNVV